MVPIKIQKYLGANNAGASPNIGIFLAYKTYIALLQVRELVENDELKLAFDWKIKELFGFLHYLVRRIGGEQCQVFAASIKIHIMPIELIEGPNKIPILHPAFTKGKGRAIVKLAHYRGGWNQNKQKALEQIFFKQ